MEDPYIIIDVTSDLVAENYKKNMIGKQMRYYIVNLEKHRLTIRDEKKRTITRYLKDK